MLKTIEQGGEGGGVLFFILCKKIFDEVSFYFIKDFFAPQRAVFYFFITFLSDAGGHLDLGINLEWPYRWLQRYSTSWYQTVPQQSPNSSIIKSCLIIKWRSSK